MMRTDNIPTKSSRIHRFLPWIIVVIEFLVILFLIVQIVCPHKKLVSTGGGFTSIYYKYQDPNDTDGENCYAVIVYAGLPYTVEVPQEQYIKLICNPAVEYHFEVRMYKVGHILQPELISLNVDDPIDERPDSEKNSPAPEG